MGHQLYVVVIAKRLGFKPKGDIQDGEGRQLSNAAPPYVPSLCILQTEQLDGREGGGGFGQDLFIWATIVISLRFRRQPFETLGKKGSRLSDSFLFQKA